MFSGWNRRLNHNHHLLWSAPALMILLPTLLWASSWRGTLQENQFDVSKAPSILKSPETDGEAPPKTQDEQDVGRVVAAQASMGAASAAVEKSPTDGVKRSDDASEAFGLDRFEPSESTFTAQPVDDGSASDESKSGSNEPEDAGDALEPSTDDGDSAGGTGGLSSAPSPPAEFQQSGGGMVIPVTQPGAFRSATESPSTNQKLPGEPMPQGPITRSGPATSSFSSVPNDLRGSGVGSQGANAAQAMPLSAAPSNFGAPRVPMGSPSAPNKFSSPSNPLADPLQPQQPAGGMSNTMPLAEQPPTMKLADPPVRTLGNPIPSQPTRSGVQPVGFNQPLTNAPASGSLPLARQICQAYRPTETDKELGTPVSLVQLLSTAYPTGSRKTMVEQYWKTYLDWTAFKTARDHAMKLKTLQANSGDSQALAMLELARQMAADRELAAKIQLGRSQARLQGYLSGNPQAKLPLPDAQPIIAPFSSGYERYRQTRVLPASYRGIDEALEQTLKLIVQRSGSAQAATKASQSFRSVSVSDVSAALLSLEMNRRAEQDLLTTIVAYNRTISEYILTVEPNRPISQIAKMMEGAKKQTEASRLASAPIREARLPVGNEGVSVLQSGPLGVPPSSRSGFPAGGNGISGGVTTPLGTAPPIANSTVNPLGQPPSVTPAGAGPIVPPAGVGGSRMPVAPATTPANGGFVPSGTGANPPSGSTLPPFGSSTPGVGGASVPATTIDGFGNR